MGLMYRASIPDNGCLQTLSAPAYNFGTGDFTVAAMIETTAGGVVVARQTAGGAGFALIVNSDGSVSFTTSDGVNTVVLPSGPTAILAGGCHSLIAIRSGGALSILLDGSVLATTQSSQYASVNVNNSLPLAFGCYSNAMGGAGQYVGTIMNVGLWSIALSGAALVAGAFGRVSASDSGLVGYWMLDASSDDMSSTDNPASIMGPVTWQACLNCTWTEGANDYSFFRVINAVTSSELGGAAGQTLNVTRTLVVPQGAPALSASALAMTDTPTFPAGVTITVTDPNGVVFNQDQNTDTAFVVTTNGQPGALMLINPAAGTWTISVSAPATTAFYFQAQTVPSADVVGTTETALTPLYGGTMLSTYRHSEHLAFPELFGGFWDVLKVVAVAAVVGVVVAAVVVASGGTATGAVIAGGIAFFSVNATAMQMAVSDGLNSSSVPVVSDQTGGMAGFTVSVGTLQLIDANADADKATQLIYKRRQKKLYPYVTASKFNKKQASLIGSDDKRVKVAAALKAFSSGYVTASGHGMSSYLMGWYVSGSSGPLEEILTVGKYDVSEVKGRIFHFFACSCGYKSAGGLGQKIVASGAVAFFGYAQPFAMPTNEYATFCDCDIAIDKALIDGKTTDEAYQLSYGAYTTAIDRYRADGNYQAAALAEGNRDNLVSPSTDAAYGSKTATLS